MLTEAIGRLGSFLDSYRPVGLAERHRMSVSRRIVPLTLDNLERPARPLAAACTFWEFGPLADPDPLPTEEADAGQGGLAVGHPAGLGQLRQDRLRGRRAGRATRCSRRPASCPRSMSFPTSPVTGDAVLLMNAHVLPEWRSAGLGRMLAQRSRPSWCLAGSRQSRHSARPGRPSPGCLMPADYLRSVGFKTIRPHPLYPRLRMELKSTVSWRYDVEYALERIFGTTSAKSLTPAGYGPRHNPVAE